MANDEHLRRLKEGVAAWNKWRADHPEIKPDLSKIKLINVKLNGIDFSRANLEEAVLSVCDLINADFSEANLRETIIGNADCTGADFSNAHISTAYLGLSELEGADFSGATLNIVDLTSATLTRADFTEAEIDHVNFADNDLSQVIGSDTVTHRGPSYISIDTIYQSKGEISEVFLRGAGVPDDFITYIRSLVGQAIEFYSSFISYSSKNTDFAERLFADLQNKGVRCWFVPEDLKIGDKFRQRIEESIRHYDKLLLILSEDSIRSPWVEEEVESAIEREHRERRLILFPIRIDDSVLNTEQAWAASLRRQRHIGDFTGWKDHDSYKKAFGRLIGDLKSEEATEDRT